MGIKAKIGGALAIGTMLATVLAPGAALASTNVNISGNGWWSKNGAAVVSAKKNVVKQSNKTNVNTFVGTYSNTGNNHSSFNVGGTNSIDTGSTSTVTGISVTGNTNTNTSNCGCDASNTSVHISDNGAGSWNGALVVNLNKNVVNQSNTTNVNTTVFTTSNTGGNSSSFNVGGGNTTTTGDVSTGVVVSVEGGSNSN